MEQWSISLQDRVVKRFQIEEGARLTVGRGGNADVIIDNTAISRLHTALELRNGILFVEDLNSLNGTWVNGKQIDSMVPVSRKDVVSIGKFRLAPATGGDQKEAVSVAASMDLDDATVFVTSKKTASAKQQPEMPPEKAKHKLTVFEGQANPAAVALDNKSSIAIGKDPACDLVLSGWFVAGVQCYVMRRDERFFLAPQRSLAGTWLNGLRINEESMLRSGDIIQIRRVKMKFE